jgi:hypothetical protein
MEWKKRKARGLPAQIGLQARYESEPRKAERVKCGVNYGHTRDGQPIISVFIPPMFFRNRKFFQAGRRLDRIIWSGNPKDFDRLIRLGGLPKEVMSQLRVLRRQITEVEPDEMFKRAAGRRAKENRREA